jgi:hypothetical protein
MADGKPQLLLADFTDELAAAFGPRATSRTIALLLTARDQGLTHQLDVLTSAAIMLCGPRYRH